MSDHDRTRPLLLSRGIASVGFSSFFSDAGHELTTSVLPSFVTSVLHGSAATLGVIEGVSDCLLGLATLCGGSLANDETRRLGVARVGYASMAVATGAIAVTTAIWQVAALRAAAWSARGLRSPARDSILTSLAPSDSYGRAFGIERAGDNMGAVVGPLAAAGLVAWIGIRPALAIAAIPCLLAVVAIGFAASEARHAVHSAPRRFSLELRRLRSAGLTRPLLPVVVFEAANVSTALLILRSSDMLQGVGRSVTAATSLAVVLYAAHNLVAAGVALAGGHWIDRAGPGIVFVCGAGLYVAAYLSFALPLHAWIAVLLAFCLAGSGIGLAETAESTLVAHRLPEHLRGSGFGLLGAVQAFGGLASSAVVGALWTGISVGVAFTYAAALMAVAAVVAVGSVRSARILGGR